MYLFADDMKICFKNYFQKTQKGLPQYDGLPKYQDGAWLRTPTIIAMELRQPIKYLKIYTSKLCFYTTFLSLDVLLQIHH